MNVFGEHKDRDAFDVNKIYLEIQRYIEEIRRDAGQGALEDYVSTMIRFLWGRASLSELDNFVASRLKTDALAHAHDRIFMQILDGCHFKIVRDGSSRGIASTANVTAIFLLKAALHKFQSVESDVAEPVVNGVIFHLKNIVEDAIKVRAPFLITPCGTLRLNIVEKADGPPTHRGPSSSSSRLLTATDFRNSIEMSSNDGHWTSFADEEMRSRLRNKMQRVKSSDE